jgi:hypothetical protein
MKNFFKELLDELMAQLRLMFKHTTVQGNIKINIPTNYNLPISSPPKKVKRKTKRVVTTVCE